MNSQQFIPYQRDLYDASEMIQRSEAFRVWLNKRRTVRTFSDRHVPKEVIENIILSASSAPSGAHKQPWTFCAVSNAELKSVIRKAAEEEEYTNYHGRMSEEWLEDLKVFDTDWNKPFIDIAPWVIVIFRKIYDIDGEGNRSSNYYVTESVGIATGFFLAAVHQAGLVALTHTPSPMNFLAKILKRPKNEKPFLLIPIGYPAEDTKVPVLRRKELEEVSVFFE